MPQPRLSPRFTVAAVTLLVWALAAASVAFWLLRVGGGAGEVSAPLAGAPDAGALTVDSQAVARALGAVDTPVAATEDEVTRRLALRGVLTHGAQGAALISVDGKPAKPLRVGGALEGLDGWTLRSVAPHSVVLVAGARQARLEMPPLDQRSGMGGPAAGVVHAPQAPAAVGSGPVPMMRPFPVR